MDGFYRIDPAEDDFLDGCDLDLDDNSKNTRDEEIAALVLFADVDFDHQDEVEARREEWEALFNV